MSEAPTSFEGQRVSTYIDTVERMEPQIARADRDAALASIAVSLRRIADVAEWVKVAIEKDMT